MNNLKFKTICGVALLVILTLVRPHCYSIGDRTEKMFKGTFPNTTIIKLQKNDATLKETVKWMTSKVESEYIPRLGKFNVKLKWSSSSKTLQYFSWSKDESTKNVVEFDPKNIDPKSISSKVTEANGFKYAKITFSCNLDSNCMDWYDITFNGEIKGTKFERENYRIFLYTLDENNNLPNRFMKAFKHLIKLRGGEGEKF